MILFAALFICQNYQGYPIGPRTTGMGGAATALGVGAGNSFYNPAAIAWASEWTGDVSGNLVAVSFSTTTSELGQARPTPQFSLQLIPANMSFEWRGLKLGVVDLSKRWGLGVSIIAPFDLRLSQLVSTSDRTTLGIVDVDERTYAIYNSIGYRVTDALGIGFSIVAMYREVTANASLEHSDGEVFESVVLRQTRRAVGHAIAIGASYRPSNGFRAGLAIRAPVTQVFGFGDDNIAATFFRAGDPEITRSVIARKVESRYERPWRFNFGLAYELPKRFAIAADLSVFTPLDYVSERDASTGETLEVTRLVPVVNAAVGVEVYLGTVGTRLGFFTDHSPYPRDGQSNLSIPRIDRYGGTLTFNYERRVHKTEIGVMVSGGRTFTTTLDLTGGTLQPIPATGNDVRVAIVYSSTLKL